MRKQDKKPLKLSNETIRQLTSGDLVDVVGGTSSGCGSNNTCARPAICLNQ